MSASCSPSSRSASIRCSSAESRSSSRRAPDRFGPTVDVSGQYGAPTQQADGSWVSYGFYPTGVTLANVGDTMTFTITISVSHRIADVTSEPGVPLFGGPGVVLGGTCTVTAV
jgi:plastocyanin